MPPKPRMARRSQPRGLAMAVSSPSSSAAAPLKRKAPSSVEAAATSQKIVMREGIPKPLSLATSINDASLLTATHHLASVDSDLAGILRTYGPPPLWAREPSFATLIHIILEQQVSLASAKAAFTRLVAATNPLTPERLLLLEDAQLKAVGFSRQKTSYARGLATALLEGRLQLHTLSALADDDVRTSLCTIKGIGRWSSDIYLLMALLRADVWPQGDLALAIAVQQVKRLSSRPTNEQMLAMSEKWRPYRAVAARLFWHHYLSTRAAKTSVITTVDEDSTV